MAGLIVALLAAAVGLGDAQGAPTGRTFYVASDGDDSDAGTSPAEPWRTVTQVDRSGLRPGDTVLFRGGETFSDEALMPGWGTQVSGTARAPITFGSYGGGQASLTQGIWLGTSNTSPAGPSHLIFRNLALGPGQGFQGTGNYIAIEDLMIRDLLAPRSEGETGIESEGSHWVIVGNSIDRVGDSGMLLGFDAGWVGAPAGGHDYLVYGNVITNTGLDRRLDYGSHGIYLKVADATVSHNRIVGFRDDGVSARYHGARIVDNYIARGSIGIAWFQYDRQAATSWFVGNEITDTTSAGIFVCGVLQSCMQPIESFVIERNRLSHTDGARLVLQSTRGIYRVADNP